MVNDQTRDRPWLGTIYLIAIYDRDLSEQEILQNFAAGPTSSPSSAVPAQTGPGAAVTVLALLLSALLAIRIPRRGT